MTTGVVRTAWFPHHVPSITCWCRPRWETCDCGNDHAYVLHRQVIISADSQPRCFQSWLANPPV